MYVDSWTDIDSGRYSVSAIANGIECCIGNYIGRDSASAVVIGSVGAVWQWVRWWLRYRYW